MGWLDLGLGKKDPLDKIEIPKEDLPDEIEKPKGIGKTAEQVAKQKGKTPFFFCNRVRNSVQNLTP